MITASELFSVIRNDGFFENVFNKDVDWDAELDARDADEFDRSWNTCYELLNEMDFSENKEIRDIREFAFKQTFRLTQNSELAGYTSDDFDLISKALDNKIDVPFINKLWDSYQQGNFPTRINT